jgi:hypothetical protein
MLRDGLGEHSLSRTEVSEWHWRFKAGRVSAEDDEFSGRPSTSKTTEKIVKALCIFLMSLMNHTLPLILLDLIILIMFVEENYSWISFLYSFL